MLKERRKGNRKDEKFFPCNECLTAPCRLGLTSAESESIAGNVVLPGSAEENWRKTRLGGLYMVRKLVLCLTSKWILVWIHVTRSDCNKQYWFPEKWWSPCLRCKVIRGVGGSESMAPFVLNFCTRWIWVACLGRHFPSTYWSGDRLRVSEKSQSVVRAEMQTLGRLPGSLFTIGIVCWLITLD